MNMASEPKKITQYSGRGRSRLRSTSTLICAQEISSSISLGFRFEPPLDRNVSFFQKCLVHCGSLLRLIVVRMVITLPRIECVRDT